MEKTSIFLMYICIGMFISGVLYQLNEHYKIKQYTAIMLLIIAFAWPLVLSAFFGIYFIMFLVKLLKL